MEGSFLNLTPSKKSEKQGGNRIYQWKGVAQEEADNLQCSVDEHGDERPYLRLHRLRLQSR